MSSLANQHVEDPDVPAASDGSSGYAEWVQISLILFRVELENSLRETDDTLTEIPGILVVFALEETPHYSSVCRWNESTGGEFRRLLRALSEQASRNGRAAIDANGVQRAYTSIIIHL